MSEQLARILSPVTPAVFFERYWGKEYLYRSGGPNPGSVPVNAVDLDRLLQSRQLPAAFFEVFRDGVAIPIETWSDMAGPPQKPERVVLPERLMDLHLEGASLVINGADRFLPGIGEVCRRLAKELEFRTQANMYVSPPGGQGFSRHADAHEVLVLQVHGTKVWRLFPVSLDPVEIETCAGDALYIPRGLEHQATAGQRASIHVTLGLKPVYAYELIEELAAVAREHPAFRHSVGPWCPGAMVDGVYQPGRMNADFATRLSELITEFPLSALFDRKATALLGSQEKGWEGRFTDMLELPNLTLRSRVQARPDQLTRVAVDLTTIKVECAGRTVAVPLFLKSMVERILTGEAVVVEELRGLVSTEGKLSLVREFVKCGILRILDEV